MIFFELQTCICINILVLLSMTSVFLFFNRCYLLQSENYSTRVPIDDNIPPPALYATSWINVTASITIRN